MKRKIGLVPMAYVDDTIRQRASLQRPPALPFEPLRPAMVPVKRDRLLLVTYPGRDQVVVERFGKMVMSVGEVEVARAEILLANKQAQFRVVTGVDVDHTGAITVDGRPVIRDPRATAWP